MVLQAHYHPRQNLPSMKPSYYKLETATSYSVKTVALLIPEHQSKYPPIIVLHHQMHQGQPYARPQRSLVKLAREPCSCTYIVPSWPWSRFRSLPHGPQTGALICWPKGPYWRPWKIRNGRWTPVMW